MIHPSRCGVHAVTSASHLLSVIPSRAARRTIKGVTQNFIGIAASEINEKLLPTCCRRIKGEAYPDGDEILYVISGRLRVTGESDPTAAIEVGAGEACIVWKGEWHLRQASVFAKIPARLFRLPQADRR